MKWLVLLLILTSNFLNAQYTWMGKNKYISFAKVMPLNEDSDIGIDWTHEKAVSEFTLEGKNKLSFKLELLNDSIAVLSQKVGNNWKKQDTFQFQPWQWSLGNKEIVSQFKITDFDCDGDDDLLCWVMSNINGNEWTYIYLNNGSNLVKLYDTAEESFYWFAPEFNKKKNTIKSQYYGSAYGHDYESIYKLEGTNATPLKQHFQNRESENIIDHYYKGENGKWKLIKTETAKPEEE